MTDDTQIPGVTQPLTHTQTVGQRVTVNVASHPPRVDSPEYVKSRSKMNELAALLTPNPYGPGPWEDHHGSGWWLKDAEGWFLVRGPVGIEWSAQFCCEPAKVDALRITAKRLYAAFPAAVDELGIRSLLDTPITDAAGVATWVDSLLNASVPLPKGYHTGVVSATNTLMGVHDIPTPITDIQHVKRDDFTLVIPVAGGSVAVAPVAPRGSGDGRVQVLHATKGSSLHQQLTQHHSSGDPLILPADHGVAQAAFAKQTDGPVAHPPQK